MRKERRRTEKKDEGWEGKVEKKRGEDKEDKKRKLKESEVGKGNYQKKEQEEKRRI